MKKLLNFLKSDIARIIVSLIFFVSALIFEQKVSGWGVLALYVVALILSGGRVFVDAVRGILRRDLLDEKFLMSIASIGAMIVGEWREGVAVMLFFLVGETFEHYAVRKSRASIRSLMDICPDEACVITDDGEEIIDADDVEIGSIIVIRPGERVPIDSEVVFGSADVDTASMTGEPIPVPVSVGSQLSSGFIVTNGLIHARTLRGSDESAAARILSLVENANESKSKEESFITRFSRYYTPAVVIIALLVAVIPPIFGWKNLSDSIYTALTFLVISCPCALVISVPMAFFGGIGGAASRGILFKGGNVFSKVATVDSIAFDKTGTITNGKFTVTDVITFDVSKEQLLSMAASAEYASNHPIAECIKSTSDKILPPHSVTEYAGYGILAEIYENTCAVGNIKLMQKLNIDTSNLDRDTEGAVYVAINGRLAGIILISDIIKSEAAESIGWLRRLGVKNTYILSGDREENVVRVGRAVGIDKIFASLTPEQKYNKLEQIISDSNSTMYVGDGINDSPSLARADVGVAMGGVGQDSAIEAADVVIMTDNLSKLGEAVLIARKTINISWQNIIFALGVKGLILILGLLGFANMWLAVFADVGVAVLAILNSMRALRTPKATK
ncbi:MAG: cadmium-translocating P-type ATPase [Clostridia bacterium]|nr:cadmium-translocating P-type ATPase [Clostridia bacterium]